jgi:hypothetical protein
MSIKRTILYYPNISIPNDEWLRQAIFYFDEVASIVPQVVYFSGETGELLVPLTPELEYLRAEEVFRPIPPEKLFLNEFGEDWEDAHRLGDEFRAAVMNARFKKQVGTHFVPVHCNKLSATNMDFLEREGLLKYDAADQRKYEAEWFLVEETTALLYMSMLAQALADIDMQATIPGTDRPEYEELIYSAFSPENAISCVETHLRDVLPVPRQDVDFKDILSFKRKRKDELNRYRMRIDDLQKQLSQATERAEVNQALVQFKEAQQTELSDLVAALRSAKVATIWGSVKTLIKAKDPMLWGAGAAVLGLTAGIGTLPISLAIAGAAVSGTVEVGSYLVDQRNNRRATERESSFAVLYHAKAEGIL